MALKIRFQGPRASIPGIRRCCCCALRLGRCAPSRWCFSIFGFFLHQVPAHCGRAAQAADLCQHRQDLRRAARGAPRAKAHRAADRQRAARGRLLRRWRLAGLSQLGTYSRACRAITVRPGPQSYHAQDGATIHISGGWCSRSPTITASRFPAMNWSRCSSPA
jgi:hypothetical protein